MAEDASAVAIRVLAQLAGWMEDSDPAVLCRLLCTSKSLHDQLLQPGSCKQLTVGIFSIEQAAALASWLGSYGGMLQDLILLNFARSDTSPATTLSHCIASGIRSIPGNHLRSLRSQDFELPASLLKAQALRGLQVLDVEQPGCRSLMHLSALTGITRLRLGDGCTWHEPTPQICTAADVKGRSEPVDVLVNWPTGLSKLEFNCDPRIESSLVISGLTSLTSLCYTGPHKGIPCHALPAAPGLRALSLQYCDVHDVLETIRVHMKGLQTLIIQADQRTDQQLRQLFVELRDLKVVSVRDIKTAAGVSAVACATGVQSLWLDVPQLPPAGLKHLSQLTGLTSLSLCGWESLPESETARPEGSRVNTHVVYAAGMSVLSGSLPHLLRLAVYSNHGDPGCSSGGGLQVIGMLYDPAFFPRLQVWIVPQEWVAECDRYKAAVGAEAALPPASRQLLADLRQERPGLVINWWQVMCDCYDELEGLFKL